MCLTCRVGFYLRPDSICASSCPNRYYFNSSSNICNLCSTNCSLCFGPTECSACASSFFLFPTPPSTTTGLCVLAPDCPLGTYGNSSTSTCARCPYDCSTCSNGSVCSTCNETGHLRSLDPNTSRCVPLNGYYDSGATVATPCVSPCTSCLSATFCTACNYLTYLSKNNTCVTKCLQQLTFYGQPRPTCDTCPYDCLTCNNYGECLTCDPSDHR